MCFSSSFLLQVTIYAAQLTVKSSQATVGLRNPRSSHIREADLLTHAVRKRVQRLLRQVEALSSMVDRRHCNSDTRRFVRDLPAAGAIWGLETRDGEGAADVGERRERAKRRVLRLEVRAGDNVRAGVGVVVGVGIRRGGGDHLGECAATSSEDDDRGELGELHGYETRT